jgi:hypothetical protein
LGIGRLVPWFGGDLGRIYLPLSWWHRGLRAAAGHGWLVLVIL